MSSNHTYTPYCYLIGWSSINTFYYGRRTRKGCHPEDLMVSYFTSSKLVKKYIEKHGLPDVIEVRKTFKRSVDASVWEHKVLRRLNAAKHPRLLNQTNGDELFDASGMVVVTDKTTGKNLSVPTNEFYANRKSYASLMEDRAIIQNIETGETSEVPRGTIIDREKFRFVTGKPLGTKESAKSRKLKSEAGKKKLTVRCLVTGKCSRHDRDDALRLVEQKTHTHVMMGERTTKTRELLSEAILENARLNRVCDLQTRKEYSTAKFLARDQMIANRKLSNVVNRVCDIKTQKEYTTRNFITMMKRFG